VLFGHVILAFGKDKTSNIPLPRVPSIQIIYFKKRNKHKKVEKKKKTKIMHSPHKHSHLKGPEIIWFIEQKKLA
jgi:hypothetical protein